MLYLLEEEELFLGLALQERVLRTLGEQTLSHTNLGRFCLAVEGVSHFLCVMHRAAEERSMSALEMELQAEVDKYIAALLIARRCPTLPTERLRPLLYRRYFFVRGLSQDETDRYEHANQLADRYTHTLEHRFVRPKRLTGMVRELRRFYRLNLEGKQDLIRRAA